MKFPSYEEWLPGFLARQKARIERRKQMVAAIKLRKLARQRT